MMMIVVESSTLKIDFYTHSRHHNIFDSISKSLEKAEEEEDMRVSRVPL